MEKQVMVVKSSPVSIIMRSLGNYIFGIFKLIFKTIGKAMGIKSKRKSEEDNWKKPPFVGLTDIIRPWIIEIDEQKQMITTKRRNWYLISVDEQNYLFNTVRQIFIDKHLFGADLYIRVYAGRATAISVSKSNAEKIKQLLLARSNPTGGDVIIDVD